MVYRLRCDLFFDSLADLVALRNAIQPYYPKIRNALAEKSRVQVTHQPHART